RIELACSSRGDDSADPMFQQRAEVAVQSFQIERKVGLEWRDRKSDHALESLAKFVWLHSLARFVALPPRENSFPVWVNLPAHFGFVVAFAVAAFRIALAATRELIVIQFHAQSRLVGNADAAVHNRHATTQNNLILRRLPRIMGVAS